MFPISRVNELISFRVNELTSVRVNKLTIFRVNHRDGVQNISFWKKNILFYFNPVELPPLKTFSG